MPEGRIAQRLCASAPLREAGPIRNGGLVFTAEVLAELASGWRPLHDWRSEGRRPERMGALAPDDQLAGCHAMTTDPPPGGGSIPQPFPVAPVGGPRYARLSCSTRCLGWVAV